MKEIYEKIPLLNGLQHVKGIVQGKIQMVPYNPSIVYRAENEDNLIFIEAYNFHDIIRKIGMNYPEILFKIYKIFRGKKSDKFYYFYNQQIFTIGNEDFVIIEIPEINKTYSLKEPSLEILSTFYKDHSNYDLHVPFFFFPFSKLIKFN